jgi:hypothetical protein
MGKIPPQKRPHNRPVWYVQKSITSPTLVTITLLTRPLANFILEVEHDNKDENEREMQRTQVFFENSALLEMLKR